MVYILFLYTINPTNRKMFLRKILLNKQTNLYHNKDIFTNKISKKYTFSQINNVFNNPNFHYNNSNNNILHINKCSRAGGANTNLYGKKFEEKTKNEIRLVEQGFSKILLKNKNKKASNYYLFKKTEDKNITYVLQSGLKVYMKQVYNIHLFRYPDEAYIFEHNDRKKIIKILEKKEQCVEGSVETKLWSGPSLKREYELMLGDNFKVYYGFCVNSFLKEKFISNETKYNTLSKILNENNITVLFGDDANYFDTFDKWLNDIE